MRKKKISNSGALTVNALVRTMCNPFISVLVYEPGFIDVILPAHEFYYTYMNRTVKRFNIDTENDILAVWIERR